MPNIQPIVVHCQSISAKVALMVQTFYISGISSVSVSSQLGQLNQSTGLHASVAADLLNSVAKAWGLINFRPELLLATST